MEGAALLTWDRVDSPVVKEYRVFSGAVSGRYTTVTNVGNANELPIENLKEGSTYFFAVTCRTRDGVESAFSQEFRYKVPVTTPITNPPPVHLPPTLNITGNTNMLEDLPFELQIQLKDGDTAASNLVVFASYPEGSVFGKNPIVLTGSGEYRTLRLMPATNAFGATDLSLSVTDGTTTNTHKIHMSVVAVDDAPVLADLPNLRLRPGESSGRIALGILDPDTPPNRLKVWATCADPNLLPAEALIMEGVPSVNATLQINAPADALGISAIRVGVADDLSTNWTSFQITVEPTNTPPVVDMKSIEWGYVQTTIRLSVDVQDDGVPLSPGKLIYGWSLVSGPAQVLMSATNTASVGVLFGLPGRYVLHFDVSDGELSAWKECIVDALPALSAEVHALEMNRRRNDPSAPHILEFDVVSISDSSLTVSWRTDTACDGRVEWSEVGALKPARTPPANQWTTQHSVTLQDLRPGKDHTLRAWSRNLSGGEQLSDPLIVRTLNRIQLYQPLPVPQATLTAPLIFGRDDQGLWGVTPSADLPAGAGEMSLSFGAIQPGNYNLWARVRPGPSMSFPAAATLDATDLAFDASNATPNGTGWIWAPLLPIGQDRRPLPLRIESGEHQVLIGGFGPGMILSDLILTMDPDYLPEDIMPIAGLLSPAGLDTPILVRALRQGWSLLANPFPLVMALPGASIPNAPPGTEIHRLGGRNSDVLSISYDGIDWSGEMRLDFRQAVRVFNPSSEPLSILLNGVESTDPTPTSLPAGERLFTPNQLKGGLLRDLMPGFVFKRGDTVKRIDRVTGETLRTTYNGQGWDVVPALNAGEAIILDLVPR
ncbi:MAG: fibronectin type III domain-containing protein [Verrucomicrobia bacterium]|nr:fibronectin type III domain-containing protein [Verrucomicrobiota bacterium]